MPGGRSRLGRAAGASAVVILLLAAALYFERRDPNGPGQVWRRGLLGGEQVRLLPGGRYELQRWRPFAADETLEGGTWTQLGQVVSLVPGQGGPARVMRVLVRGEARYLSDAPPGAGTPAPAALFERLD